jgi:hypothetical protein
MKIPNGHSVRSLPTQLLPLQNKKIMVMLFLLIPDGWHMDSPVLPVSMPARFYLYEQITGESYFHRVGGRCIY